MRISSSLKANAPVHLPQRLRAATSIPLTQRRFRPIVDSRCIRDNRRIIFTYAAASSHGAAPLHTLSRVALIAMKFFHEAFSLIERLFQLLQRLRTAAKSIQESVDPSPVQLSVHPPTLPKLSLFKTLSAITHLRHTLTDATGTLDAKWNALETTASDKLDNLFIATTASAAVVTTIQQNGGKVDPHTRHVARQSNEAVVKEEQALREQVFAQVYTELRMNELPLKATNSPLL